MTFALAAVALVGATALNFALLRAQGREARQRILFIGGGLLIAVLLAGSVLMMLVDGA